MIHPSPRPTSLYGECKVLLYTAGRAFTTDGKHRIAISSCYCASDNVRCCPLSTVIRANSAAMPGHRISVSRDAFQTLRRLYHEACRLREECSYQITVLISVEVD
ncbi:hypothetical protein DTO164E3_9161 [Paecilomyces variotii]|nr:hypothetical protein DTO164E3_9161 [Paecilomyces variotii]